MYDRDRVFGWDYPPGTMRGSGIYEEEWEGQHYCQKCEDHQPGVFTKNDWGSVSWLCDTCADRGDDGEVHIDAEELGPDPDEAWDSRFDREDEPPPPDDD